MNVIGIAPSTAPTDQPVAPAAYIRSEGRQHHDEYRRRGDPWQRRAFLKPRRTRHRLRLWSGDGFSFFRVLLQPLKISLHLRGARLTLDWRNEPVPTTMKRFNKPWIVGLVAERLAQLLYRAIQAVIEVNECVGRPKSLTQFFPVYDLSGTLQQDHQYLKGLFLQPDPQPALAQFAFPEVNFERPKAEHARSL